jgi:hypothetical protein
LHGIENAEGRKFTSPNRVFSSAMIFITKLTEFLETDDLFIEIFCKLVNWSGLDWTVPDWRGLGWTYCGLHWFRTSFGGPSVAE